MCKFGVHAMAKQFFDFVIAWAQTNFSKGIELSPNLDICNQLPYIDEFWSAKG
jgi:hypothetical protein